MKVKRSRLSSISVFVGLHGQDSYIITMAYPKHTADHKRKSEIKGEKKNLLFKYGEF